MPRPHAQRVAVYHWGQKLICPFESVTKTPVYSTADVDDNGEPDNPGKVLYYSELPRFEKDRRSLNYGITATFSVLPLDNRLADLVPPSCGHKHQAPGTAAGHQKVGARIISGTAMRPDLAAKGVRFVGRMSVVCSDLIVTVPPVEMVPHTHAISAPSLRLPPEEVDGRASCLRVTISFALVSSFLTTGLMIRTKNGVLSAAVATTAIPAVCAAS